MKKLNDKISLNISQKSQKILFYVCGLLLLLVAYMCVFKNVKAANDELILEVNSMKQERVTLQTMVDKQAENEAETARLEKEIKSLLKQFPADVLEEDVIMYADSLEQASDIEISDISTDGKNLLYSSDANTDEDAVATGNSIYLYTTPATYTFKVTYDNLKSVISAIQSNSDLMNLESIVVSYDTETGMLMGTLVTNGFSIQGGIREYESPQIPEMSIGTNNLFNTIQ